ncbi:hypothetical protein B0H13DRAFT_2670455 [Mycena leptocephala]|nr:hypothetical protein B0H13DRAFT_2670455 [Mycena leptocephala]
MVCGAKLEVDRAEVRSPTSTQTGTYDPLVITPHIQTPSTSPLPTSCSAAAPSVCAAAIDAATLPLLPHHHLVVSLTLHHTSTLDITPTHTVARLVPSFTRAACAASAFVAAHIASIAFLPTAAVSSSIPPRCLRPTPAVHCDSRHAPPAHARSLCRPLIIALIGSSRATSIFTSPFVGLLCLAAYPDPSQLPRTEERPPCAHQYNDTAPPRHAQPAIEPLFIDGAILIICGCPRAHLHRFRDDTQALRLARRVVTFDCRRNAPFRIRLNRMRRRCAPWRTYVVHSGNAIAPSPSATLDDMRAHRTAYCPFCRCTSPASPPMRRPPHGPCSCIRTIAVRINANHAKPFRTLDTLAPNVPICPQPTPVNARTGRRPSHCPFPQYAWALAEGTDASAGRCETTPTPPSDIYAADDAGVAHWTTNSAVHARCVLLHQYPFPPFWAADTLDLLPDPPMYR